jgi:hypothetical protein
MRGGGSVADAKQKLDILSDLQQAAARFALQGLYAGCDPVALMNAVSSGLDEASRIWQRRTGLVYPDGPRLGEPLRTETLSIVSRGQVQ